MIFKITRASENKFEAGIISLKEQLNLNIKGTESLPFIQVM